MTMPRLTRRNFLQSATLACTALPATALNAASFRRTLDLNVPEDSLTAMVKMRASLLPEYAEPEDIANSVCFVASEEAKFINGALLSVDGGVVAA